MATFIRPTFSEILDRVKADIDSRLPDADSRLRRSLLNVIAYIVAGVAHGLYGFISWIALQVFPDTAEAEFLNRWAAYWGITRVPAGKATGIVTVTGTDGAVLAEGTELQRSDEVLFVTTEELTLDGISGEVAVEAVIAGESGNTEADATLTLTTPLVDIDSETTVGDDGIAGGTDIETDASLLERLLNRVQQPPHGGNENDYEQWALANEGVTRAWVYPQELGDGTVTVRFMMDDTYDDGIPQAGDVDDVQAYIETRRPVTADLTVVAPIAVPLDFEIQLNIEFSQAIKDAIELNLIDLIRRDAEPAGTIYLSRINEAISLASGEFDHVLIEPAANVTHTTGQIATMGDITWS